MLWLNGSELAKLRVVMISFNGVIVDWLVCRRNAVASAAGYESKVHRAEKKLYYSRFLSTYRENRTEEKVESRPR